MCGGLFGGGGGYSAPEVQKVNPTPTQVTPASVATQADKSAELDRQRKKRGYMSTVSNAEPATTADGKKTTLG